MEKKDILTYLSQNNFVPSKKMGQNFLFNKNLIKSIVNNIAIHDYDLILEIGPGLGALTSELINLNKPLTCVELDKRLTEFLKNKFLNNNFEIINDDFLNFDLNKLNADKIIVIANIPYSITTPIIFKCLSENKIKNINILIQKEVANKLTKKIKSNTNAFTTTLWYYSNIKNKAFVGKDNFVPAPNIDSSFIEIIKNGKEFDVEFNKFLNKIFLNKRKTLLNNLKHYYKINLIEEIYNEFNLIKTIRAEEINPNTWFDIYKYINDKKI